MPCRWPSIPSTQELRELAKLVTAVEELRAGYGRRIAQWLEGVPPGDQPSLGAFLYAIVMSEDAIQSETRRIEGLVYG